MTRDTIAAPAWAGDAPASWTSRRVSKLANPAKGLFTDGDWIESPFIEDTGVRLIQTGNVGVGVYKEQGYRFVSERSFRNLNCTEVLPGDILISRLGDPVGRSCIAPDLGVPMITSVDVTILRTGPDTDVRYVNFALSCRMNLDWISSLVRGSTRDRVSRSMLGSFRIPTPPLSEQVAIADFLDRETAEIDGFVGDQEALIGLLAERRAATISHAVTKGFDTTVPMKASGIEWYGCIPANWEIKRIKQFVSVPVTDGPHETPELVDEGVPFVSAEAIGSGVLNLEKIRGYISEDDDAKFARKYRPRRDDIYMVKSGATTGVVAIVDTDVKFNIWSPLAAIRCDESAHPRFLLYALKSMQFQESVRLHWNYGTQQNIGMSVIENLPIVFPNIGMQEQISDRLDLEVGEIDAAIADAHKAILLSQERRAALISAAVTGKIDVRDHGVVA